MNQRIRDSAARLALYRVEIQSRTAGHHLPYSSDATFSRVVSFFQSERTTAKPTPITTKATTTTADDKDEDEDP